MLPYAIVEFKGKDSISIIPTSWFCGPEEDSCYWPPKPTNPMRINKLISKGCDPDKSTWEVYEVRSFGKAKDYKRAREKAVQAEDTSNIDTDTDEQPRKRRKNRKYGISDDSSSDSGENEVDEVSEEFQIPSPPPGLREVGEQPSTSLTQQTRPIDLQTPLRSLRPVSSVQTMAPVMSLSGNSERSPTQQSRSASLHERNSGPATADVVLKRVLSMLEGIRQTQKVHGAQLQLLLNQVEVGRVTTDFELPEGLTFPIKTKEELEGFDQRIQQDEGFLKGLIIMLGDMGGRTIEETVKRLMAHVMADDFALQCNMSGRNKKTGFGQARMFDVVYRAVKRNSQTCSSSKKDVEIAVAKWLIGSRDRIGGNRRERLDRRNAGVEEGQL